MISDFSTDSFLILPAHDHLYVVSKDDVSNYYNTTGYSLAGGAEGTNYRECESPILALFPTEQVFPWPRLAHQS